VTRVLRIGRGRQFLAAVAAALMVLAMLATPGFANQGRGHGPGGNPAPGPQQTFELTILHINDGESALLRDTAAGLPGVARFAADLFELRDEADRQLDRLPPQASQRAKDVQAHRQARASLTISAGDNYLAGPRLNASRDDPAVFYDALVYTHTGFDAMTIGNHEFDFGPGLLAEFITATDPIPFISANLDFSGEPVLADLVDEGRIAPSTVVTKAGRDIGIIGATYEELASISSPGNVTAGAVLPAVQAEADRLTAEGVDIIILSSHLQDIATEVALVSELSNVDAVVGGGGGESLGEDYPLTATDSDGRTVPIVTVPGSYTDIGKLVLHFDERGDLLRIGDDSQLVPVPLDGPQDAYLLENVEAPVAAYVAELAENEIANTTVPLDGRRGRDTDGVVTERGVRNHETNLGNLMADAHLEAARDFAAANPGVPVADIALQNGGGMRSETIHEGTITELETFNIAAFSNFIAIGQIDGTALKSALERSVAFQPLSAGSHGQWAGIRFNYDTSRQAQTVSGGVITRQGERIQNAIVTRHDGEEVVVVKDGVLLAPEEVFTLASIDFILRDGGDGYVDLEVPILTTTITYQQSLAWYLEALGTVTATDYPDVSVSTSVRTRFGPIADLPLG
jgi:2',3'-cyclic-nucleotide 2'-phosphodiesterase (5'-nucleotidase family)